MSTATTPRAVRAAVKAHNLAVEQRAEDYRQLLATEWGRRWLCGTLKLADPMRPGRMDLFDAGRTDFTRSLLYEARIADLRATLQMEQEDADRRLASEPKRAEPEEESE